MINILKKILESFRSGSDRVSNHFRNLDRGEKIYIDGKSFVKVKLRFVDTLDFEATQYMEQLENLVESQRIEIENLKIIKENLDKKTGDMQILNINLFNARMIDSEKLKATIAELIELNENKDIVISQLQEKIQASDLSLTSLNGEIQTMGVKLRSIGQRNDFLENEIQHYRKSRAINSFDKRDINRLKRNPDKSLLLMFMKNKEIDEKDELILKLRKKQKEYIRIIEELRNKFNSRINT